MTSPSLEKRNEIGLNYDKSKIRSKKIFIKKFQNLKRKTKH